VIPTTYVRLELVRQRQDEVRRQFRTVNKRQPRWPRSTHRTPGRSPERPGVRRRSRGWRGPPPRGRRRQGRGGRCSFV